MEKRGINYWMILTIVLSFILIVTVSIYTIDLYWRNQANIQSSYYSCRITSSSTTKIEQGMMLGDEPLGCNLEAKYCKNTFLLPCKVLSEKINCNQSKLICGQDVHCYCPMQNNPTVK